MSFNTTDIVKAAESGMLVKGNRPYLVRAFYDHLFKVYQDHKRAQGETAAAFGITARAVQKARENK